MYHIRPSLRCYDFEESDDVDAPSSGVVFEYKGERTCISPEVLENASLFVPCTEPAYASPADGENNMMGNPMLVKIMLKNGNYAISKSLWRFLKLRKGLYHVILKDFTTYPTVHANALLTGEATNMMGMFHCGEGHSLTVLVPEKMDKYDMVPDS
jgi:hypothetical protein